MRYYILIFLFVLLSCRNEKAFQKAIIKPSRVDSLSTEAQVENLIHSIDSNYQGFKLASLINAHTPYQPKIDSLIKALAVKHNIDKTYYKEDFDTNGFTDVLVIGNHAYGQFNTFVILNYGNGSYQIKSLLRDHMWLVAPEIKNIKGSPVIIAHQPKLDFTAYPPELYTDSKPLVYKFNNFIEYKSEPSKHVIEKIEFAAEPCFGTCPVFQINIDSKRKASFIAQYYNFSSERGAPAEDKYFEGEIGESEYTDIHSILNYIDFPTLNNEYSVGYTDAPGVTLRITYDGGKIKEISDYGQKGSYGLMAIYDIFRELRFNQNWQSAKEPKEIRIHEF